jgi:hypothetical protein
VFPSPMDVAGKVRIAAIRTTQSTHFETAGASTISRDVHLLFLSEFGPAIRERLKQGPLSLDEALNNGWCQLEGQPALSELLGTYVAPWCLGTDVPVEIRVPKEVIGRTYSAVGEVILSNLELALRDKEGGP